MDTNGGTVRENDVFKIYQNDYDQKEKGIAIVDFNGDDIDWTFPIDESDWEKLEIEEYDPWDVETVKSNDGIEYEVRSQDGFLNIEWRKLGYTDWNETLWSIFCEVNNVELDALA